MRQTLRRSCDTCARSKHSCDLRTPRCSRCTKRKILCVYANEPLTAPPPPAAPGPGPEAAGTRCNGSGALASYRFGSVDPFDSYPQTRLPREHVQRLIHSFLHKIAFQYYPLDLNATSNPFLVSWWPLALGDPALFHVSLQTACLDEELLAQKGFQASEILMADSVALLRRKVEDTSLALQDGTMNSVITLAAIEFGKGNIQVSEMHVDGVTRLVNMRGGINSIRQTSPLTARMVSWVSLLVKGYPQFETQDDDGLGHGLPPIPEWQLDSRTQDELPEFGDFDLDPEVRNVFNRLRAIFVRAQRIPFPATRLHDLTCFAIHRLLSLPAPSSNEHETPLSECLRYAMILYMFIVHGPTYYPHSVIQTAMMARLKHHLQRLEETHRVPDSLEVFLYGVGLVAGSSSCHYHWLAERAWLISLSLQLSTWEDVFQHIRRILWLGTSQGEDAFRPHWENIISGQGCIGSPPLTTTVSPDTTAVGFLL